MTRNPVFLLTVIASTLSAACAGQPPNPFAPDAIPERWNFTMGVRGQGTIAFQSTGFDGRKESGECSRLACPATVEEAATLVLTPVAASGFRFVVWHPNPVPRIGFLGDQVEFRADGSIVIVVGRDWEWIAEFEGIGGGPTTPGG